MNIVNSGGRFVVYGEDVKTYKQLPADTYLVDFDPLKGYSLTLHNDLTVCEKVYGPYAKKVEKVMHTFDALSRNMGIILSGPKGVGKSVFARMLAEEGKKRDLPLIIITKDTPGLPEFISTIQQECIILFDEFEKVFKSGRGLNPHEPEGFDTPGPQDGLLSLFDGIDDGKKLYVITCNNVRDLSTYLLNRPGRFHYHFMLNAPTGAEIREYLNDNLVDDAKQFISEIVTLSGMSSFTYDVLRAIVFELNQGYSLEETLQDLNIERDTSFTLNIRVTFTNGITVKTDGPIRVDLNRDNDITYWFDLPRKQVPADIYNYCENVRVSFPRDALTIDENGCTVNPALADIFFGDADCDDDDLDQKLDAFADSFKIASIKLEKTNDYMMQMYSRKFGSFWD